MIKIVFRIKKKKKKQESTINIADSIGEYELHDRNDRNSPIRMNINKKERVVDNSTSIITEEAIIKFKRKKGDEIVEISCPAIILTDGIAIDEEKCIEEPINKIIIDSDSDNNENEEKILEKEESPFT